MIDRVLLSWHFVGQHWCCLRHRLDIVRVVEYLICTTMVAHNSSTDAKQEMAKAISARFLPETLPLRPVTANAMPHTTNSETMSVTHTCQSGRRSLNIDNAPSSAQQAKTTAPIAHFDLGPSLSATMACRNLRLAMTAWGTTVLCATICSANSRYS